MTSTFSVNTYATNDPFKSATELSSPKKMMSRSKKNPLDELASLRRLLMQDEDIRPCITGVLAVKIKRARLLQLKKTVPTYDNTYCSITIRNFVKRTHVVSKTDCGSVVWNQTKHFPVVVPTSRKHPFNLLRVQVVDFSSQNTLIQKDVGGVSFHLHDMIPVSPITGTFDLWDQNQLVGDLELEITFSYGSFGYGYSPQLKEEKRTVDELLSYSLFPRITPPQDQMESDGTVLIVKALPHPSYIPFKNKVHLSYGKEIGDLKAILERQYAPEFFGKDLKKLEATRDQYFSMNDRVSRLMFLHKRILDSNCHSEVIHPNQSTTASSSASHPHVKSYTTFTQPFNHPPIFTDEQFLSASRKFPFNIQDDSKQYGLAGVRGPNMHMEKDVGKRKNVQFQVDVTTGVTEKKKKLIDQILRRRGSVGLDEVLEKEFGDQDRE
ncbi:hypothetical protein BKA69DRAFT_1100874 [Paraphysoderma sedebokerense]|nr:hypothetical protein BKA69DRAFT_1100874 [Paraphysoderma sedebokerense]